jgi:hypothetical protein
MTLRVYFIDILKHQINIDRKDQRHLLRQVSYEQSGNGFFHCSVACTVSTALPAVNAALLPVCTQSLRQCFSAGGACPSGGTKGRLGGTPDL